MKTLSDKLENDWWEENALLWAKDVKEFIEKCFEEMEKRLIGNKIKYGDVVSIIKKRAGSKLIGKWKTQKI